MPQYLDVDGHQVYSYEWDNNGEAVLLLHGGLSQTSHWDQNMLPAIEDQFHVFGYDRTAHGFTGDREGSLHFDYQVKEAIAYLETVVTEPAHLIGILKFFQRLKMSFIPLHMTVPHMVLLAIALEVCTLITKSKKQSLI